MAVVVGNIPTKEGRAALKHAAQEARLRGCALVVVTSSTPRRSSDSESGAEFDTLLGQVREELSGAGLEVTEEQSALGREPADDLIDVATAKNAQCIIIGLRRRTPIGKLILGSNAQRVLLEAPCPVIAVKGDS